MTLNSIFFILVYMPVVLLVFYLVPKPAKLPVLAAAGLCFYAASGPVNLLFLGVSVIFNYLTGLELGILKNAESDKSTYPGNNNFLKSDTDNKISTGATFAALLKKGDWSGAFSTIKNNRALIVLIAGIAANLFMLGIFKYSTATMPLGISFFTFSAISFLVDVYRNDAPGQTNLLKFTVYLTFFPKIISGPIVRYADFHDQLENVSVTFASVKAGAIMFLAGLMKKVLLADRLGIAFGELTAAGVNTGPAAWLGVVFFSLQLYFDFSGYSDMAIGLAKMFGFDIKPNFDYPYTSENVSVFWRKWHISLGEWFKHYVYFPLGGSRVPTWRIAINIMVVWTLTGLWHGSTMNYLFWGLYSGALVLLDKFVLGKYVKQLPVPARIAITVFAACMGWVFFFSPSLGASFMYFGRMLGGGTAAGAGVAASVLARNVILLIVSIIGCTQIPKNIFENLFYRRSYGTANRVFYVLFIVAAAALLLLTIAEMIGATNTTFLYAEF